MCLRARADANRKRGDAKVVHCGLHPKRETETVFGRLSVVGCMICVLYTVVLLMMLDLCIRDMYYNMFVFHESKRRFNFDQTAKVRGEAVTLESALSCILSHSFY